MSRREPLFTRAPRRSRIPDNLREARDVVLPELVGGLAGAPLPFARRFHQFFFEHAELAVARNGLLVLQDVVIGRLGPLLREIQLWGSAVDPTEMLRMSTEEIAHEFGLDLDTREGICTESLMFVGALRSSPCMGDEGLERRTIARLLISTTRTLAGVAPYVRVGHGVVWAYRPSNVLSWAS